MKIGVTTTIREIYKNQFEYSIDQRLIKFLNKSFLKPDIRIIFDNKIIVTKCVIGLCGITRNILETKEIKQEKEKSEQRKRK